MTTAGMGSTRLEQKTSPGARGSCDSSLVAERLRWPTMRAALAVANSDAGSSTEEAQDAVLDVLREGLAVELVTTSSPDELEGELTAHPDAEVVVVLGGDGS